MSHVFGDELFKSAKLDDAVEEIAVEVDYLGTLGDVLFFFLVFYFRDHLVVT